MKAAAVTESNRKRRVVPAGAKQRALRTTPAADYLGISPSYLRKMRLYGEDDPQDPGPAYIRVSKYLVVYEIEALDAWLNSRAAASRAKSSIGGDQRRSSAA
jgi:hypothetical protein